MQFISCISEQRPFILLLDDLQWADDQTFEFLQALLTTKKLGFFLLLGGYRSNEVDDKHPLKAVIHKVIEEAEITNVVELPILPITFDVISDWVDDWLNISTQIESLRIKLVEKRNKLSSYLICM